MNHTTTQPTFTSPERKLGGAMLLLVGMLGVVGCEGKKVAPVAPPSVASTSVKTNPATVKVLSCDELKFGNCTLIEAELSVDTHAQNGAVLLTWAVAHDGLETPLVHCSFLPSGGKDGAKVKAVAFFDESTGEIKSTFLLKQGFVGGITVPCPGTRIPKDFVSRGSTHENAGNVLEFAPSQPCILYQCRYQPTTGPTEYTTYGDHQHLIDSTKEKPVNILNLQVKWPAPDTINGTQFSAGSTTVSTSPKTK